MGRLQLLCSVILAGLIAACASPTPPPAATPGAESAASTPEASTATTPDTAATTSAPATTDATAAPQGSSGSLAATTWQWVGLADPTQQVQIDNPASYTISFIDDANVSVTADCNQAAGTYSAGADGTLTIELGPATLVACPPGSRGDEFRLKLDSVARYSMQDGNLLLEMMADGGTMTFTPATGAAPAVTPPAGQEGTQLVGTSWRWIRLTDPTQEVQIENPANYTLTFTDATSISMKADCNQASASYTAGADGTLTITPGITTLAACPQGSRGDEFVQKLSSAAIYFMRDGHLFIDLVADGGTLEFEPQ